MARFSGYTTLDDEGVRQSPPDKRFPLCIGIVCPTILLILFTAIVYGYEIRNTDLRDNLIKTDCYPINTDNVKYIWTDDDVYINLEYRWMAPNPIVMHNFTSHEFVCKSSSDEMALSCFEEEYKSSPTFTCYYDQRHPKNSYIYFPPSATIFNNAVGIIVFVILGICLWGICGITSYVLVYTCVASPRK
ncbi:hypothetical protein BH23THE1_BH23THE1_33310 [soil metagenome]